MNATKKITKYVLSSTLIGTLVLGLGGRLLMRLIAVLADIPYGFSWGGTMDVILFGALIGFMSGVVYSLTLLGRLKDWSREGLFLGLGTFVVIMALPIDGKAAIETLPRDDWLLVIFGFGVLFLVYGMVAAYFLNKKRAAKKPPF